MKKLFPLFLALVLLPGCAVTYDGPTTTELVLSQTRTEGFWDSGDVAFTTRTVYSYDIYGNHAQWIDYTDDEPTNKTVHRYDDRGNLIRTEDYYVGGWFPSRTQRTDYTYDDLGRVTSTTNDYGDGDVSSYTITYDDEQGTRTTAYTYSTSVSYYDAAGHLIRTEYIHDDGTVMLLEYTLRPDGQPVSHTSTTNGVVDFTLHYEYDDQGRPTRQTITEDGVQTEQFRWEYDDEELYEICYQRDGSYIVTGYYEGDRVRVRESWDANGKLQSRTIYDYQEIRVPIDGRETP